MEKYTLAHMNPNLAMVAQVFPEGTVHDSGSGKSYLDVRIFRSNYIFLTGQKPVFSHHLKFP